ALDIAEFAGLSRYPGNHAMRQLEVTAAQLEDELDLLGAVDLAAGRDGVEPVERSLNVLACGHVERKHHHAGDLALVVVFWHVVDRNVAPDAVGIGDLSLVVLGPSGDRGFGERPDHRPGLPVKHFADPDAAQPFRCRAVPGRAELVYEDTPSV